MSSVKQQLCRLDAAGWDGRRALTPPWPLAMGVDRRPAQQRNVGLLRSARSSDGWPGRSASLLPTAAAAYSGDQATRGKPSPLELMRHCPDSSLCLFPSLKQRTRLLGPVTIIIVGLARASPPCGCRHLRGLSAASCYGPAKLRRPDRDNGTRLLPFFSFEMEHRLPLTGEHRPAKWLWTCVLNSHGTSPKRPPHYYMPMGKNLLKI